MVANTTSVPIGNSVVFTISTQNIANGTTLYYTLNNSSTATSTNFTTAVNGSVVINGGANTFTLSPNNNITSALNFYMDLRTGSSTGTIVGNSQSVNVGTIYGVYNGYVDQAATSGATTWSASPIGTASTNRRVIVTLYQRAATLNSNTASAVTIGGVSASLIVSRNDDDRGHVDIWGATVPTGTTADIVVTWINTAGNGKVVGSYSLYGANATAYSTSSNRVLSGGPTSANVNVVAGGFVIAATGADAPGGNRTQGFTAGVDVNYNGKTVTYGSPGFGSRSISATQTNYTITSTTTDSTDLLLAVASFQPG
jgi:hypothetical protein